MRHTILASMGVLGLVMGLSACGTADRNSERFVSGNDAPSSVAERILSDGTVSKVENEQVLKDLVQCYADSGLAGSVVINVDIDPWWYGQGVGMSPNHPQFKRVPENIATDDDAMAIAEEQGRILNETIAQCNEPYQEVIDWIQTHKDVDAVSLQHYDDEVRCVQINLPQYAFTIDPQWRNEGDYNAIWDMFDSMDMSQTERDVMMNCQINGLSTPMTFGPQT